MQKKPLRNKDFRTLSATKVAAIVGGNPQNPKAIRELLSQRGGKLEHIMVSLATRQEALEAVRRALPRELAPMITSAGIDGAELRLGATNGAWATRLRYVTGGMRERLSSILGVKIERVKIRVARAPG
jgi:hypothetical protein